MLSESVKLGAHWNVFHAGFVVQDFDHLLGALVDVEHRNALFELTSIVVQQGVVQDVMDEVVNGETAWAHFHSTLLEPLENHLEHLGEISCLDPWEWLALLDLSNDHVKVAEKLVHGVDLANQGVERVSKLVIHKSIYQVKKMTLYVLLIKLWFKNFRELNQVVLWGSILSQF